MSEGRSDSACTTRRTTLSAESLEVSRRLLSAADDERKAASPLELAIDLREHVARYAVFAVKNASTMVVRPMGSATCHMGSD